MKHKFTYSRVLFFLLGLAALTGLLLVFVPMFDSLPEPKINPSNGQEIGMISGVTITFPDGMNHDSVESRISVKPETVVTRIWDGNSLTLFPSPAFPPDTDITMLLNSGSESSDGKVYQKDFTWHYSIRSPQIAYLGQATTSPEIYVTDPATGSGKNVTRTGGNITGFAPFPDGSGFLYSAKNEMGGADIHRIGLDGSKDQVWVKCGKETCGDPTISRDGRLYAFSWNHDPEDGTTSKYTYVYTGLTASADDLPTPLVGEKNIRGILPAFSPDGLKVSFYDANSKGLRVMNQGGSNDFLLGSNRIQSGSWSPDGSKLAFVDDINEPENVSSKLYIVDLKSSSIDEPLKTVLDQVELGEPDWSPDGSRIVVGVRKMNGPIGRQLWLLDLKAKTATQITDDLTLMNAAPRWRPDGKAIVFQQAQPGSSGAKPKIILWDKAEGKFTTIASDAAMPAWVP